ncbi:MAG TPA: VLRF1 family aeRF1-type release factor [Candidatus Limnocylindria bacterium]|nr:VLRF1 family aeRF1-type release factor [Candidatus Limnocylindria bacterium]
MNAERTPSLTSVSRNPTEDKRAVEGWHSPGGSTGRISLDALGALGAEPPGKVLSLYLPIDAREGAAATPAWRIRVKDALNRLLDEERDRAAATALARLGRWLLERLEADLDPGDLRRSLAVFGTETPRRLEVFVLPQPIDEPIGAWSDTALLEPLREMEEAYPRMGIAVLDAWHARLLTSWLGTVTAERDLERSEDTADWREMKGTAYTSNVAGGATKRDAYQRRMREHDERWWRDLVPHLQRRGRSEGWTSLAVVADEHLGLGAGQLADAARLRLVADLRRDMSHLPGARVADAVARAIDARRSADQTALPSSSGRMLPKK